MESKAVVEYQTEVIRTLTATIDTLHADIAIAEARVAALERLLSVPHDPELSSSAALMGAKGGRAGKGKPKPRHIAEAAKERGAKGGRAGTGDSKRRDIDYAALGRLGGLVTKAEREPKT